MLDFVQQLVSGIALGCVYGLIALGFVLIYKATEVVNFAQGDLMMLGGFFGFTFIGMLGFNYWFGFAGAVIAMALFGMLAERVVVSPILGYPQFSIIMVTIGLGYFLRSMAGIIWGTDDLKIDTPFSQGVLKLGTLVLAYTVSGGTKAVSITQKYQLTIIMAGMILAGYIAFSMLPEGTTFGQTFRFAGEAGKLNLINLSFNLSDRYNIWSGLIGGLFLFLSYFGADQSQVGRYLGGASVTESRPIVIAS